MIAPSGSSEHCVILAVSSDIGSALARDWLARGYSVAGTFRTPSTGVEELQSLGVRAVQLDLDQPAAIKAAAEALGVDPWSRLVLAAGSQEPVGLLEDVDPIDWGRSIESNFISQFQFLSWILPFRSRFDGSTPRVLSFAGGATNRATTHYSAYTISKIASIKMTELLAEEVKDVAFTILGPGWVRTKIHQATVKAGAMAGDNLRTTLRHLEEDDFVQMADVIASINWIMSAPPSAVSGRNISAVFDPWGSDELTRALVDDPDLFKLRRYGNDQFLSVE